MKLLSPSSFASSTFTTTTTTTTRSTTSFDGNSTRTASGCIAGVFRWLLCYSNLPTYPSDYFKEAEIESNESDKPHYVKAEGKIEAPAIPGLVARLMGVESMPWIDLVDTTMSSTSIARSRSKNSVDSLREIESNKGRHQSVKSFCKAPPIFFELEDEHFFILSFENGIKTKELGPKTRKLNMGSGDLKQRREGKCSSRKRGSLREYEYNKENQGTDKVTDKPSQKVRNGFKIGDSKNLYSSRQNFQETSHAAMEVVQKTSNHRQKSERKKLRKRENCLPVKALETESDSENSSPVSVLDFDEFITSHRIPTLEEYLRLSCSNSRRKLPEKLESCRQSLPGNDNALISKYCEAKRNDGKCIGSRKEGNQNQNYLKMFGRMCKLAETEMMECNWIHKELRKLEEFEEIGADFGLEILQELLLELVDQLLEKSHEYF